MIEWLILILLIYCSFILTYITFNNAKKTDIVPGASSSPGIKPQDKGGITEISYDEYRELEFRNLFHKANIDLSKYRVVND